MDGLGGKRNSSATQRMTLDRKHVILKFRHQWMAEMSSEASTMQHTGALKPLKTKSYISALIDHLMTHDKMIGESDVKRWVSTHPWITDSDQLPKGVQKFGMPFKVTARHQGVHDTLKPTQKKIKKQEDTNGHWKLTQPSSTYNSSNQDPNGSSILHTGGNNTPEMPNLTPWYDDEKSRRTCSNQQVAVATSANDDAAVPPKKRILFRESTISTPILNESLPEGENINVFNGHFSRVLQVREGYISPAANLIEQGTSSEQDPNPYGYQNPTNVVYTTVHNLTPGRYTSTPINTPTFSMTDNGQYDLHREAADIENYESTSPNMFMPNSGLNADPSKMVRIDLTRFLGHVAKTGFREDPWKIKRSQEISPSPPEVSFHIKFLLAGMEKLCKDYGEGLLNVNPMVKLIQKCQNVFSRIMKKVELPVNHRQALASQVQRLKIEHMNENGLNDINDDHSTVFDNNKNGISVQLDIDSMHEDEEVTENPDMGNRFIPSQVISLQETSMGLEPPQHLAQGSRPVMDTVYNNGTVLVPRTVTERIIDSHGNELEKRTNDTTSTAFQNVSTNYYDDLHHSQYNQPIFPQGFENMNTNVALYSNRNTSLVDLTETE